MPRCVEQMNVLVCMYEMYVCVIKSLLTDVDECVSDNGGCEHTCQNTAGSYQCFCHLGHHLADDKHSCVRRLNVLNAFDEAQL